MSSSEENFNLDVSDAESEGYSPVVKKTSKSAPKAKPAAKAPPKPRETATKAKSAPKKVLADHNDYAEDNAMDVDHIEDASEPGPSAPQKKKTKTASEKYTMLSHIEQILKRPDSYIGSVETITQTAWTYDLENKRMVYREVRYVPGFYKIVDEILVNAADNKINDPSMDAIKVNIDTENNTISVYNNGRGIPIEIHTREKMYIPELIFGHLLSSSNYDDDEKKLTGGRNGYGAKLANIYSHEFTIETADKNTGQKYKQTWTENMSKCGKAKITKNTRGEEYTRVTFRPDLARFGMDRIDEDIESLLKKRVYDMAGTVKDIKVYLNDERLKIKNFKQYVEMYLNSVVAEAEENSGGAAQAKQTVIFEQIGPRWEAAFAVSDGSFQQVSFANSIATTKGGTHVSLIADQIAKNLIMSITKKNKGATVKPMQIKNHMWIFVNALIENPTFDSQTKETLTLPAAKFGTKPTLSEEFMKKVQKSSIVDHVLNWAKFKADQQIKKTDGSKRSRLTGLPKLSDANNAGTKKASECTLILTEGDSAKTLAIAGLSVVGRDNFGVFPLRGKLLNVREAKHDQIMKNEEIQNIKKIMGLQHNKEYTNVSSLRYGQLMIMTDQDYDGSHIKGLIINFLDHFYPSLLKIPKFLVEFITPIVKATRGKDEIRNFYTMPEYERWLEDTSDAHKWELKYLKGLGSSDDKDGKRYFSDMKKHMIPFASVVDGDKELIDLAFSKKKADDRKEWLRQFKPGTFLDHTKSPIYYSDFINKELILFSMADNIRSIPSVADGLKPGQRKVMWASFKRKLVKSIKVVQLAGYVSEHAAYHHGEVSLYQTIINLAQDFVGSNNINLLYPDGGYGSREAGGKDHASARYIHTRLEPVTRSLFHPSDDVLWKFNKEENLVIEPEWYLPVVPTVLINGTEGIGTGWSTNIPPYNPEDVVANIRRMMAGEELQVMTPWWRGFKGTVRKTGENKYDIVGVAKKINDTTIEITELPIHKWTQNYKSELEGMIGEKGEGPVKDYKEYHDNVHVRFVVSMAAKDVEKAEEQGLVEFFKLTSKVTTTNMICFDFDGKIKKYQSPEQIIEEFYPMRLAYYQKRKDHIVNDLQMAADRLSNQARFVQMIVEKELVVSNRKKVDIVAELRRKDFRPFPKGNKSRTTAEVEEEDEVDDDPAKGNGDFDYLLGMAIWSLTKEKFERLRQQAADKEAELIDLVGKPVIGLWDADLDDFIREWKQACKNWEEKSMDLSAGKTGKAGKRKQKSLRKSLGGARSDDSDDDFKPGTSSKPWRAGPTKAAKSNDTEGDDDVKTVAAPKKAGSSKKAGKIGSDTSPDAVGASKPVTKKAPAKKAPPKIVDVRSEIDDDEDELNFEAGPSKKSTRVESDSGSDGFITSKTKKAPSKKLPPKAAVVLSDSDFEMIPAPVEKGKGKAKEPAPPKRKSLDKEDDSDDELYTKPTKKKKSSKLTDYYAPSEAAKKPTTTVRKVSSSMKPASRKVSGKKTIVTVSDDEEDDENGGYEAPPAREAPRRRAASTTAKKYVEVTSEEENKDGDYSLFEDD